MVDDGEHERGQKVKESYVKKLLKIEEEHFKKYGYRHTSIKDLRKEIEHEEWQKR